MFRNDYVLSVVDTDVGADDAGAGQAHKRCIAGHIDTDTVLLLQMCRASCVLEWTARHLGAAPDRRIVGLQVRFERVVYPVPAA
jgi:hypothetical protein